MKSVRIHHFFDKPSGSLTYVVWDGATGDALVIDPVLDFDPVTQMISQNSLRQVARFAAHLNLRVHAILETHVHADHLSAAREAKKIWPAAQWGLSHAVGEVFENFRKALHWPSSVQLRNLPVDRYLRDGEELRAGSLKVEVVATPGHTPACVTFQIGENLFVGDTLLMPDAGTGRCDFPGGSAEALHQSIWAKLFARPEHFRVWVGHDYQPGGRHLNFQTTLREQKAHNLHLRPGTSRADFVAFRQGRDKTLTAPRLLQPSLDWNLGAHQLLKPLN